MVSCFHISLNLASTTCITWLNHISLTSYTNDVPTIMFPMYWYLYGYDLTMCVLSCVLMISCKCNISCFIHTHVIPYIICIKISDMQIKTFFETMRTRFGKISAKKSGQGLKKLSHREQFIYSNFRFLWGHIRRTASRQSDTVSTWQLKLLCLYKQMYVYKCSVWYCYIKII